MGLRRYFGCGDDCIFYFSFISILCVCVFYFSIHGRCNYSWESLSTALIAVTNVEDTREYDWIHAVINKVVMRQHRWCTKCSRNEFVFWPQLRIAVQNPTTFKYNKKQQYIWLLRHNLFDIDCSSIIFVWTFLWTPITDICTIQSKTCCSGGLHVQ